MSARCLATLPLLMIAACASRSSRLPVYQDATLTPRWISVASAAAPGTHRIAPFAMVDQHDAPVTERAFAGKVTIAHFFFTSCGDVCPTTVTALGRLLDSLHADTSLQVLSYSVAAKRDSVSVLRDYAEMRSIRDPRWHLLTGNPSDIERLARESYFVRLGDGASYGVKTIAHTESLLLVDGQGRIRGIYAGTLPLEVNRLREDIGVLESEH